VNAVKVPVTLKTRTGWDTENKNCIQIAKFKQAISIPVIANGDIDSPEKAKHVLEYTGADA